MSYIPSKKWQGLGDDEKKEDAGTWGTVKKIGSGALDVFLSYGKTKGEADSYKQMLEAQRAAQMRAQAQGMPKWVLPAGIAAGAVALILVLKK